MNTIFAPAIVEITICLPIGTPFGQVPAMDLAVAGSRAAPGPL
jgi:hypothetical protein